MRGRVIGVALAALVASACSSSPPPAPVTVTSTIAASAAEQQRINEQQVALDQRQAELDARESAIATAEAQAAENTFTGDGMFLVGKEIQPGTWRSLGGDGCYWERLSSLDGGGVLDNDSANGPTIAQIAPTDVAFSTDRCGKWTRIG